MRSNREKPAMRIDTATTLDGDLRIQATITGQELVSYSGKALMSMIDSKLNEMAYGLVNAAVPHVMAANAAVYALCSYYGRFKRDDQR